MRIVVIGGTGLIGSGLARRLLEHGHGVVAASPATGVNTLTGEGVAKALDGALVVVDVSNSQAVTHPYLNAQVTERTLVPHGEARRGTVRFDDWLSAQDACV
jgi:uncharacterized protein YbjT (DUF2867 family)